MPFNKNSKEILNRYEIIKNALLPIPKKWDWLFIRDLF